MIPASEALQRLKDGNARFAAKEQGLSDAPKKTEREDLVKAQHPFAIVLGCADSRVPPEMVFDQGLGDLFVVRVAGNIVSPSLLGSIEFAAVNFKVQLVVVLGHTKCGAIAATVDALKNPPENISANLQSIVSSIQPSVEALLGTDIADDRDTLIQHATRAHVQASAAKIQTDSNVVDGLRADGKLRVVGAEYALETGIVSFFDET